MAIQSAQLRARIDPRDGKIPVICGGKGVRMFPVDIREAVAIGADITFPDGGSPTEAAPRSGGFDFSRLDMEELKHLYVKAQHNGATLPQPNGRWGRKKYAEVLADSGWEPRGEPEVPTGPADEAE